MVNKWIWILGNCSCIHITLLALKKMPLDFVNKKLKFRKLTIGEI